MQISFIVKFAIFIELIYKLERILIAEGHSREADALQKVDLDTDAHCKCQVECHPTVDVVQRKSQSRAEDGKPDNSTIRENSACMTSTGRWTITGLEITRDENFLFVYHNANSLPRLHAVTALTFGRQVNNVIRVRMQGCEP
jgi:hypothetical protein